MSAAPYPGLRPFNRGETDIFFGREEQVDELVDRLAQTHFLSVVGASGSGKSSLVRAGLLDALESGFMAAAGAGWQVADMRPGRQPMLALAEALLVLSGRVRHQNDSLFLKGSLQRGRRNLVDYLGAKDQLSGGDNLLILVDQFEELFRFATSESQEEADTFVALLLEAAKQRQLPVYVVITMRSDFIGQCTHFTGLPQAVNDAQFLTPRLTREQSRQAIEGPARVFGGQIEEALVNRLLNDMGTDPDQLPLMQHALMRMWNLASATDQSTDTNAEAPAGTALALEDYKRVGGLKQSLSQHANEVYDDLQGADKQTAQVLFRVLTERDSEQRDTRRPTALKTVAKISSAGNMGGGGRAQVERVVAAFRRPGRSFIVPPEKTLLEDATVLDISHESLIRQWDRLKEWTEEETEAAATYRELVPPAQRWQEKASGWRRALGGLWRGIELRRARTWRRRINAEWAALYKGDFQAVERFIGASHNYAVLRGTGWTALLVVAVLVLVVGGFVFWQTAIERQRAEVALENLKQQMQLTASADSARQTAQKALEETGQTNQATAIALVQAREAEAAAEETRWKAQASEERRTRELFDSQLTHASLLARSDDYAAAKAVLNQTRQFDAAVPPGRRHARDFLARFAEIQGDSAQQVYEGAGAPLRGVAVSPDGQLLAATGENGTVVMFDVESGAIRQRLEGHSGDVNDVVFHPQGAWLATGDNDRQIIRWSLPAGDTPAQQLQVWEAPGQVWSLAVSPDGVLLASGGTDDDISLWEAETGRLVRNLEGHTETISEFSGLTFSPSGKILASGSYDDTARLWDVKTGESRVMLQGHNGNVYGVFFTPDERHLVTSSADKRLVLWEVESGQPLQVFTGHENYVVGVDFVASRPLDETTAAEQGGTALLVSASMDRTLRIWDATSGVPLRVLQGHTAGALGIAVHAPQEAGAGVKVFSSSNDGTVRRWDSAPLPYQRLVDLPGEARSAAISSDGRITAVGFEDGALRIYALPEGHLLGEQENAHEDKVKRLAFSADGRWLASASFGDTAKLWLVGSDGLLTAQQTFSGHTAGLYGLAFSPDSQTLATAGYDGRVGLFTVDREKGQFFDAHEGEIASVVFNQNGTRLLSAGIDDKTARIWDITANPPTQISAFPAAQDNLSWAAFSPDGRSMVSVGRDPTVDIYSTHDAQLQHRLVGHESTIYRAIFSPDGQQLASVSADATVRLWDLETGGALFTLRLPTNRFPPAPLWDFDFRCTPTGCWLAVPLTRGKLALYDLGPYAP